MNIKVLHAVVLAGWLGCSGSKADFPSCSASVVPVSGHLVAKEVSGRVIYAYEGTGWKTLEAGKVLAAGATVKTDSRSAVLLKVKNEDSFVRVSSEQVLHLTAQRPPEELDGAQLASRASARGKGQVRWHKSMQLKPAYQRVKWHF